MTTTPCPYEGNPDVLCSHEIAAMPECAICGERVPAGELAEMYDASMLDDPEMYSEAQAGLVHAECGIAAGWQVA